MEKTGTEVDTIISEVWEVRQVVNQMMFYGGIIGAVLFGIGAIILFFVFRIYTVIGELTGITAKRSIKKIQKEGYEGKSKIRAIRENTDKIVPKRGRTTGRLQPKENIEEYTTLLEQGMEEQTTLLNQQAEDKTTILDQTSVLEQTSVLDQTSVLEQTSVLGQISVPGQTNIQEQAKVSSQTSVLEQEMRNQTTVLQQPQIRFEIEEDVVVTHTEERI